MKHIFAILSVCLVAVHGQSSRPPKPPRFNPKGTPVPMPDALPTRSSPPANISPPRPRGCSPGCGPTEICAELGASYCRNGVCSVCIKMSSIRFPASALAAMFSQSQQKPETQPVQTQPIVQMQPPANPFSRENVRYEQVSEKGSHSQDQGNSEKEMSILEYAAKQRRLSAAKTPGKAKTSSKVISKPPPPPPPAELLNGYQVFQENSNIDSSSTAVEINNVQSTSTSVTQTAGTDVGHESQKVKYPIIVRVTDPTTSVEATSQKNAAPADNSNGILSPAQTKEESHLGHIDHDQMTKWYQQYQAFKQQNDIVNRANRTASTQQTSDTFDYATFQAFQTWLQTNQQQAKVPDQTTVRPKTTPVAQPQIAVVSKAPPGPIQPLMTVTPQNMLLPTEPVQQANTLDFNALQHQYNQWLVQQQNTAAVAATPKPVAVNPVTQPAPPVTVQPPNALSFASMQQQFLQWQQQQQQQQQNQVQSATVQPQINTVVGTVPQPLPTGTQSQTQGQPGSFDFATFQSQYHQWQQEQAQRSQAQTQTTAPTFDFAAFQQHMQQQRQQTQGQNAVTTQTDTVQGPNIPQNQQPSSQEIQYNVQPNPQMSQQQNTFSYMPQQPANTYNDPFANNFNPPPQNNNLMDLMMFSSLGLGGGLFAF